MTLGEKKVRFAILVVDGLLYSVTIGDPSMEELKTALDMGNRVASFVMDGEVVWLPLHPEYLHLSAKSKDSIDAEEFTSSTSGVPLSESPSNDDEKEDHGGEDGEFNLTIRDDCPD